MSKTLLCFIALMSCALSTYAQTNVSYQVEIERVVNGSEIAFQHATISTVMAKECSYEKIESMPYVTSIRGENGTSENSIDYAQSGFKISILPAQDDRAVMKLLLLKDGKTVLNSTYEFRIKPGHTLEFNGVDVGAHSILTSCAH
ncbi:hypothetical protein QN372_19680 [Undibacterium sp. RTI2.1]|uniref:hypothetical protein n=1 Tax=unclassified Undibacterium TaxID=2630295 RepID=UPI002B224075|nr:MULTISPECIES: hypothetical protein [unclassified Undibacterium]MEB0032973.1 hypothetical protein [Undibacterium sp. RTI2.1]MEB0118854.1 hypothetical protein [Undibacterium sp. RTI2.2]